MGGSLPALNLEINKRRSRTVSFRLSEEEYGSLKNVTTTCGARSVSEFTRSVACDIGADTKPDLDRKLAEIIHILNDRMGTLDHRLQMLTDALENKNSKEEMQMSERKELRNKEPLE